MSRPLWLLPGAAATALAVARAPYAVVAGDSGELAAAAHLLGTGHPPGQSFYLLAAKAASLALPFGTIPFRLGLLSALSTGGAVALLSFLAQRIAGGVVGIVAGCSLLLLPALRDTGGAPEVYPLLWLALALMLAGIHLSRRLAAGAAGLAAAIHPEGAVLCAAAAAGGTGRLLAIAAVPLAVLIYPLLRLAAGSPLTWWLTADWRTAVAFLTAAPYRGPRIMAAWYPDRWARLADLAPVALPLLPWLLLAAVGWRRLDRRVRRATAALAVVDLLYAAFVNPVPPAMTPALVPLALALALPAAAGAAVARGRIARPLALLLLALPALLSPLAPSPGAGRSDHLAGDTAAAISSPLPPVATVALGSEDNDLFPQMCLQWIGAHRPDCRFTSPVGRLFPEPPPDPRVAPVMFDRFGDRPPAPGLVPSQDGLLYRWTAPAEPPRWHAAPAVRPGPFPDGDPLRDLLAASWLDRRAVWLETTGDPATALSLRLLLAGALPRDADTQGTLGATLLGFGRWAEAVAPLTAAVTLSPGDSWWRFLRGAALLGAGREADARPDLALAAGGLRGARRGEASRLLRTWGFPGYALLFAGEGRP